MVAQGAHGGSKNYSEWFMKISLRDLSRADSLKPLVSVT